MPTTKRIQRTRQKSSIASGFTLATKLLIGGLMTTAINTAIAQTALPDPASTDPKTLGWMQGFPPRQTKSLNLVTVVTTSFLAPDGRFRMGVS